ncbi:hypothetical protein NXX23_20885 [Bacteroides ovatus]|nr:hypothetical protein [Bacteroides ovatus]
MLFAACSFAGNRGKEQPKYLWFDAEANFERFASKDSISYYLEKAKSVGFNQVVVDVKPIYGEVLYKSKILPPLTTVNGKVIHRDWDYLQYFINEARRLGLESLFPLQCFRPDIPLPAKVWSMMSHVGMGKTCLEYTPDGKMLDIREDKKKVGAFFKSGL